MGARMLSLSIGVAVTIAFSIAPALGQSAACHEGNYGLRNILSGSRADEAAAAP